MIHVDNGKELIGKAIESKYKIHYNLTNKDFIRSEKTELSNGMYTETLKGELGNINVIYPSIYNLETGEITKGEIEKIEVSIHKGSIRTMKEKDNKNLTVEERIAIVGSHEIYHAVKDAEYIREYGYFDENNEQHKGAYETEEKTERQILRKKE